MDIKKILIVDEVSESVVKSLLAAHLSVDLATDATPQRVLSIIEVSIFIII